MNTVVDNNTYNIYKYGTYFNPAYKQYSLTMVSNIICVRCYKNYLNVSIGLNNNNLCLECVNAIDSLVLSGMIYHNVPYPSPQASPYVSSTTVTSYTPVTPVAPMIPISPITTIAPIAPTMY